MEICPECEEEIEGSNKLTNCELCEAKTCKECISESHGMDCPHCDGEGEVPSNWVTDDGDRYSPPSLDITSWEECDYCWGGKVCGEEHIPSFEWNAEKGIDTFTQPFEESSLDNKSIKNIVVSIGIGILGVFAYNKWK